MVVLYLGKYNSNFTGPRMPEQFDHIFSPLPPPLRKHTQTHRVHACTHTRTRTHTCTRTHTQKKQGFVYVLDTKYASYSLVLTLSLALSHASFQCKAGVESGNEAPTESPSSYLQFELDTVGDFRHILNTLKRASVLIV